MPIYDSKVSLSKLRTADSKRDDIWLLTRLDYLWSNFFSDVSQDNPIFIAFGRYSKYRLGSIKFDRSNKKSYITITAMFKDTSIPVEVVDHTIAHELCHYTHGFSSPKEQMHKFPHHGGVIQKELSDRNLKYLSIAYRSWIRKYRNLLKEERV